MLEWKISRPRHSDEPRAPTTIHADILPVDSGDIVARPTEIRRIHHLLDGAIENDHEDVCTPRQCRLESARGSDKVRGIGEPDHMNVAALPKRHAQGGVVATAAEQRG